MKTYKTRTRKPLFTPAIHDYVKAKCTVLFKPACNKYQASITINGYEYAMARETKEEAVTALAQRCAKSYRLKINWKPENQQPMTTYEYGAMSSKYSCQAENKLTAYCAMCYHYGRSAHLISLYAPEEIKQDRWMAFDGKISARLDEIFGGEGSFDKYMEENGKAIADCYNSIKQIV